MSNRDRPNILFIISDQHRFDASGCYGGQLAALAHTPNIDSLARDGVRFRHAYCQQPLCGPSRASIMTGTYSHTCNVYTHGTESVVPPEMATMGTLFRAAGYRTAAIGEVHVHGEQRGGRDLGFDYRALRMVNDPAETRNLAAQESAAAVRNTLRDRLLKSWDGVPDTWQPRSS